MTLIELKQICDQLKDAIGLDGEHNVAALIDEDCETKVKGWTIVCVSNSGEIKPCTSQSFSTIKELMHSWLEKQGEQKVSEYDIVKTIKERIIEHFDNHLIIDKFFSIGGLKDDILKIINEVKFSKQGEQKPADEPKFKVGDKIQYFNGSGTIMTIEKIENGEYLFANPFGRIPIKEGNNWHLVNLVEQKPWSKEVDLEKEIKEVQRDYKTIDEYEGYFATIYASDIEWIAKHFFELGLNASNPLTWEDIANINDIVSEIIKECDDNILYDTKEGFCKEVLKRFKAQKGKEV